MPDKKGIHEKRFRPVTSHSMLYWRQRMKKIFVAVAFIAGSAITAAAFLPFVLPKPVTKNYRMPYQTNVEQATANNQDFRRVLFTGTNSQLVVMSIPPGGEVGQETHTYTEQTLFFQSGTGEAILDGKATPIGPGDVVVVTPGTQHNFRNTGDVPLQIFTTYAPPNHIDGRVHRTKADADADAADEAVGETAPER